MFLSCYHCRKLKRSEECRKAAEAKLKEATKLAAELQKKCKELEELPNVAAEALENIFNEDQRDVLVHKKARPNRWSNVTLSESLLLRFKVGSKGYEYLTKKLPLPSLRTLQRKLELLNFPCGILFDVLKAMGVKFEGMSLKDLICGLVFDEISIAEAEAYCAGIRNFVGKVTLPTNGTEGKATHMIVFMLVGVHSRWKQIVGYHFTGNSTPADVLVNFIRMLIDAAESTVGVNVEFLTCDCSPVNRSVWSALGLECNKSSALNSQPVPHPCDSSKTIEIIPDVVHVFKSIINGWKNNRIIYLPDYIVKQYHLSSNEVNIVHLLELVQFEKDNKLKTTKLRESDFDFLKKKNHFDAMKVPNSTKFCNLANVHALHNFAIKANRRDVLPTAFFIEIISLWFAYFKNRAQNRALSKRRPEKYEEVLQLAEFFKKMIFNLRVGQKRAHKPWQTNSVLATNAVLRLTEKLFSLGFELVRTGWFTQDCVENVFSVIRIRQRKPTALQCRYLLKNIVVAQHMEQVSGSSYEYDFGTFLIGLEDLCTKSRKEVDLREQHEYTPPELVDESELDTVYYMAGYTVRKVVATRAVCSNCFLNIESEVPLDGVSTLAICKDFTGESLVYVNLETFNFFLKLENTARSVINAISSQDNLEEVLLSKMLAIPAPHFNTCHDMREKVIRKYKDVRINTWMPKKHNTAKMDSYSMRK